MWMASISFMAPSCEYVLNIRPTTVLFMASRTESDIGSLITFVAARLLPSWHKRPSISARTRGGERETVTLLSDIHNTSIISLVDQTLSDCVSGATSPPAVDDLLRLTGSTSQSVCRAKTSCNWGFCWQSCSPKWLNVMTSYQTLHQLAYSRSRKLKLIHAKKKKKWPQFKPGAWCYSRSWLEAVSMPYTPSYTASKSSFSRWFFTPTSKCDLYLTWMRLDQGPDVTHMCSSSRLDGVHHLRDSSPCPRW